MTRNTEKVERLPWVKRLKKPCKCDGFKRMPLKALYGKHASAEVREKYRCTKQARWSFRALKKSQARDGNFCYMHLIYQGIYYDMDESKRTDSYWTKLTIQDMEIYANTQQSST